MGYEVAGGLGVKMANPQREVYVLVGDGSFLMMHSELFTSLQERFKINIILFDNHGFQCIKNLQMGNGSKGFGNEFRYRSEETGRLTGDVVPIDFSKYAEALGAKTFTASNIHELEAHLKQAKKESVSTLIEIKVAPGTMSNGYESWWRVPVADVSNSSEVLKAHDEMDDKITLTKGF